MKRIATALVLLSCLAGAFLAGARSHHPPAGSGGGRKVLYYVDPMHPAYKSDRPGVAPDCGMQLEPVYADGAPAAAAGPGGAASRPPGSVHIPADKQQLIGVRLGEVERGSAVQTLRLFGRVAADETRVYTLNAALDGYIRDVAPVTTGSHVRKGAWLATFFSLDTRAPINAYLSSLDVVERARQRDPTALEVRNAELAPDLNVERMRNVGISPGQIEEIKRTRQIPMTVRIVSPTDGIVLSRGVSPGQKFEKGAEWYRIADLRRVWIVADAFENEAESLSPGMQVQVSLPGSGRRLSATVSDVLPQFDAATRTLKVRLEADNPDLVLRPDMFVDVEVPVRLPDAILVPADAVVDSGRRKTVFVAQGGGYFEPRVVETGRHLGDQMEVVTGLAPGERIVTAGTFLVDSESRLRAAAAGIHGAAARDPVCGMDVDEGKARAAGKTLEAQGKTFFFCSDQCKHTFEKSLAKPPASSPGEGHEQAQEHEHGPGHTAGQGQGHPAPSGAQAQAL